MADVKKPFNLEVVFGSLLDDLVEYLDDMPETELTHHGVVGMKWGQRKSEGSSSSSKRGVELVGLGPNKVVRKTKNGDEITLEKDPPPGVSKILNKVIPNFGKRYNEQAYMTIKDKNGKKVGDCNVWKKNDDELYLNWLGIDKSERGKGYATQAMKAAEKFGKESGFKKMTLEVPGNSPDAAHIYEKLGFKVVGQKTIDPNDTVWGGLTSMEYNFDTKVKHGLTPEAYEYFAHAGVKGMKWGRRKKVDPSDGGEGKSNLGRNLKIIGGVAAGVAVAAGAAYAVKTLNTKGNIPMSNVASSAATGVGRNLLDLSLNNNSSAPRSSPSLNLNTSSRPASSPGRVSGGPSLDVLSNLMNGGPQVSFDSSTGRYRTG